jgi:hypothetical protein
LVSKSPVIEFIDDSPVEDLHLLRKFLSCHGNDDTPPGKPPKSSADLRLFFFLPLVMTNIAMEAMAHRNRWFTVLKSMVDLSMANC